MARIIYYNNLDYDLLPTAKKRRVSAPAPLVVVDEDTENYCFAPVQPQQHQGNNLYHQQRQTPPQPQQQPRWQQQQQQHLEQRYYSSPEQTQIYQLPEEQSYECHDYEKQFHHHNHHHYKPQRNNNGNGNSHHDNNRSGGGSNKTNSTKRFNNRSSSPPPKYSSGFVSANLYNSQDITSDWSPPSQLVTSDPPSQQLLLDTLKKYFKFDSFRENQLEAVNATCSGLDTLILMPTGGGKSICYQLPGIISTGLTIVVSPLKSLIADQVDRLRSLHVKTSALFGETSEDEVTEIYQDLNSSQPRHKLLYVTPEKINASTALINLFKNLHRKGRLARFVIDEAHCVSMWGSDFRPDYRKLGKLRDLFPSVPIMALTATAPPKVRDDILDQLRMDKSTSKVFIQSFNRPNLKFEVRLKSKGCLTEICNLIRANFTRQCGIIYCLSRNDCESVSEKLREQGITSAPYHAGLPDEQRKRVFNAWSRGVFQVVCATIAFGMGIDKSDVRFVIHYSMPKSIEGYYQEAGRAGRDGKFASCILYFSKSDLYRMRSMLSKTGFGRKAEDKKRDVGNLQHMIDYVDNRNECRRTILLRYLGENFDSFNCINHVTTACDNCLKAHGGNNTI